MPQRSVASNYTFEQQRTEINSLAADFWSHKTAVDNAASTYLKHNGSNDFTGGTLNVPNAFTISSNSGAGTLTISGNLNVTGTTTTVNTATLDVTDKNITIAKGNSQDATADGAGITIDSGTDITWNFVNANSAWVSSVGVEGTTFLKGPYGQFTGSGTPSAGQGVEVNAPDANTGQIISYDRDNSSYKELRIKGSSVGVYTGTTNALAGTFNSTGLTMESGKTIELDDTIVHSGDPDTKIRFPAADQISFETGATEYLKLHRYANVNFVEAASTAHLSLADNGTNVRGILIGDGNASSTGGLRLQAGGGSSGFGGGVVMYSHANADNPGGVYIGKSAGATGSIIFGNSGTGNVSAPNEFARITSDGKLGIGTQSPTGIHNLAKVLELSGGDGGDLIIGNNASTNIGAGAHIGAIAFKNIDDSVAGYPHYAGIRCEATDSVGNMDLRFYTGIGNLEADTPQVYINNVGKVGIGVTSLTAQLTIDGASQDMASEGTLKIQAPAEGADVGGGITFGNNVARRAAIVGKQEGSGTNLNGYLAFGTRGTSGDITERLRITSDGWIKYTGTRTGDETNKLGRFLMPSHDTNEEDVMYFQMQQEGTFNQLEIGGGSGSYNAATKIIMRTAAVDTVTGQERFTIQSDGQKIISNGRLNINSTFIDFSGSISAPSTAAALFRPADNTLAISTANEERFRVDSTGNIHLRSESTTRLVLGSSGGAVGTLSNNENWIRGSGTMLQLNTAGGDYGFEVLGNQKMKLDSNGNLELRSATQNRLTFGSSGTSGNDTNWVRGDGSALMFNGISSQKWEIAGNQVMEMTDNSIISNKVITNTVGSYARYSRPLLEITAGGTPTQVKITTGIPWTGDSSHAHSVRISGFRYNSAQAVDLQICWHVYNNSFYNRAVSSSGAWAPTVTLAVEGGYVVIHLASPGYWPKMYVESLYHAFGSAGQAEGWSWTDAAINGDSGKPVETVPYKSAFGNGVTIDETNGMTVNTPIVMGNDYGISFINADDTATGETVYGSVLDDYEYGYFVPVMGSHSNINSTSGIDTSHNGSGWYTKIGKQVTVTVDFNNLHNEARDHVLRYITGLPYESSNINKATANIGYQRGLRFVYGSDVFGGQAGRYHHLYGHIEANTTQMLLNGSMSYSPYSGWPATHDSSSSQYLRITITYQSKY